MKSGRMACKYPPEEHLTVEENSDVLDAVMNNDAEKVQDIINTATG